MQGQTGVILLNMNYNIEKVAMQIVINQVPLKIPLNHENLLILYRKFHDKPLLLKVPKFIF